jgi:hypothetical protein
MTKPNLSITMSDVVLLKNFFFPNDPMPVVRSEYQALTAEDRKELADAIRATITDRP